MSLRPLRSWLPLGAVLCLSLPALTWAKAPPPVKAVKLTQTEEESLMEIETLWGGCENRQLAEGQLFRLQQAGTVLDGKLFVGVTCLDSKGNVSFGLVKDGKLEQALPRHRANDWSVYEVEAVAFSDADGDGRTDIVTLVSAMTGVGPEGSVPFRVADVWFQTGQGTFVADPRAQTVLENMREPTVKKALAALKKAHVRGK